MKVQFIGTSEFDVSGLIERSLSEEHTTSLPKLEPVSKRPLRVLSGSGLPERMGDRTPRQRRTLEAVSGNS